MNKKLIEDKVSVVTSTFNSYRFVEQTIISIQQQTYDNWEMLITDDCSIDGTWDLLHEYAIKDDRIKIFKLDKHSGPAVSRNNSIKHAKGRFIAFCDSDDQWKQDKLKKQIEFMVSKNCALTYSDYDVINQNGNLIGVVKVKPYLDYKLMLRNNYIGCLTAIYDTHQLGKIFFPNISLRQDWALWLIILKKIDKAYGLNESLAIYRKHGRSISKNKIKLVKYNYAIYREFEKFSKIKSLAMMLVFFYYYFKKILSGKCILHL